MTIKLIVGLRNPGAQYQATRHNAGEWLIQEIAENHGLSFKSNKKFSAEICEHNKVIYALPTVFMNESGLPIRAISQFYKIDPEHILVAHDELDLPPGQIKLKKGGGHGGHNGLRDTIKHLGTPNFMRLRIGIGHPGHKDKVTPFVLGKPSTDDKISISRAIDSAATHLSDIIAGKFQQVMNTLHR